LGSTEGRLASGTDPTAHFPVRKILLSWQLILAVLFRQNNRHSLA
jgi:hypothetical protein